MIRMALRRATEADVEFGVQLRVVARGECISAVWGWDEADQRAVHLRDFNTDRLQVITVGDNDVGALDVEDLPSELHLLRIDLLRIIKAAESAPS